MDQIKMLKTKDNESGQIVVIMLLIVVVVLAIGLSVVGRSNTEILTASKIENSARAFSAAEAGIEHGIALALTGSSSKMISFTSNNSNSTVTGTSYPSNTVPNIEQPNIGGTNTGTSTNDPYSFAQFWFADPNTLNYNSKGPNNSFALYFGNQDNSPNPDISDKPAVEVHVIYKTNALPNPGYHDVKYYYDSEKGARSNDLSVSENVYSCDSPSSPAPIFTNFSTQTTNPDRYFFCKVTVPPSGSSFPWGSTSDQNNYPVLIRVKVLYSSGGQNVAIGPTNPLMANPPLLPPQINVYSSTGVSGDSQRTVQVTRETNVMPYIFDFALYSDNGVSK